MSIMTCDRLTPTQLAEIKTLRKWMLLTAAIFLPLNSLSVVRPMHGAAGIIVSALAGAGFFTMLVLGMQLLLRRVDEFRRVLLMRSLTWATAITLGVLSIYGYVDLLHPDQLPRIPLLFVPMFLIVVMAACKLLIFRHHRVTNDE